MPLTVKQLETSVNASGVVRAPNPPPPTGDARVSPPVSPISRSAFSNPRPNRAVTDFCFSLTEKASRVYAKSALPTRLASDRAFLRPSFVPFNPKNSAG